MDHPNVLKVFQFYPKDPAYYYVVMEYMLGGELFDRMVKKVINHIFLIFPLPPTLKMSSRRQPCNRLCSIREGGMAPTSCHPETICYLNTLRPAFSEEEFLLGTEGDSARDSVEGRSDFGRTNRVTVS